MCFMYQFILLKEMLFQEEVQDAHWNAKGVTFHPFIAYYVDKDGKSQHKTYIVISECLTHDTIAVRLFITKFLHFLKACSDIPIIKKVFYYSDGCAGTIIINYIKFNFTI